MFRNAVLSDLARHVVVANYVQNRIGPSRIPAPYPADSFVWTGCARQLDDKLLAISVQLFRWAQAGKECAYTSQWFLGVRSSLSSVP